jgi:ribosome recycling factor
MVRNARKDANTEIKKRREEHQDVCKDAEEEVQTLLTALLSKNYLLLKEAEIMKCSFFSNLKHNPFC